MSSSETPSAVISEDSLRKAAAMAQRLELTQRRLAFLRIAGGILTLASWVAVPGLIAGAVTFIVLDHLARVPDVARLIGLATVLVAMAIGSRRVRRRLLAQLPNEGARGEPIGTRATPKKVAVVVITTLLGIVFTLAGILWAAILVNLGERVRTLRVDRASQYAVHSAAFASDREAAKLLPLFVGIGRERDAGPILNPLVPWLVEPPEPLVTTTTLALPHPFPRQTSELRFGPLDETVASADTSWMRTLLGTDHWDIENNTVRGSASPYSMALAPFPAFGELISWAQLRALQAYVKHDVLEAHEELVHLARLCASTDTLLGTMVGLRILTVDAKLHDAIVEKDPSAEVSRWQPMTPREHDLMRRAAWTSMEFANPYAPASAWELLDGSTPLDCIGLHEGLSMIRGAGTWLDRDMPGRREEAKAKVAEASQRCRFRRVVETWDETGASWEPCDYQTGSPACYLSISARVPGAADDVQRLFALRCDIASFGDECFGGYRER